MSCGTSLPTATAYSERGMSDDLRGCCENGCVEKCNERRGACMSSRNPIPVREKNCSMEMGGLRREKLFNHVQITDPE